MSGRPRLSACAFIRCGGRWRPGGAGTRLTDLYHDGLSPWTECAELAARDPEWTVFWGSINPLEGRKALDLMECQVGEFNARAFKLYNVRYDYGSPYPWRMDDPRVALLRQQLRPSQRR